MTGSVPNLKKIKIEYMDWGFDDIFDQRRLVPMPRQVEELDVRFRFSPALQSMKLHTKRSRRNEWQTHGQVQEQNEHCDVPGKGVLEDLRWRYEVTPHPFGRFATPYIKKLRVFGATTSFVAGMLSTLR